ncbi:hypothetical protein ACWCQS_06195 [Streptomyces sp. NPDC002076]
MPLARGSHPAPESCAVGVTPDDQAPRHLGNERFVPSRRVRSGRTQEREAPVAPPGSRSEGTTKVRTVCSYCGVGCGMVLDIGRGPDGRRTVLKATGEKEHPANFGRLCAKGATTADMLAAPGRLTTALVRADRGEEPQPAPLTAAVAETARRLRAIIDEHGPDAVALYVSGQLSTPYPPAPSPTPTWCR